MRWMLKLAWVVGMLAGARASALDAGAAVVKITPPVGIGLAGYYFERGAAGTADDLHARALVLRSGETTVALVTLDLISTTRPMVESARELIREATGIPPEHVMISATHAHTGPVLADRGLRDEGQPEEGLRPPRQDLVRDYSRGLPALIAEAVKMAHGKLAPARLLAGSGKAEDLAFNRRFHMKDGSVGWNPGKLNPAIVRPAGPVDPEVGVLLVEEAPAPGRTPAAIATYVNFAMHPDTVGGDRFSADYPGALARILAAHRGEAMVTLFANGACGNVNHIDVSWPAPQKGLGEAHRIGTILAAEVMRASKRLEPVDPAAAIRVRRQTVALPLPPVTAEEIREARITVAKYGNKDNRGFMEKVRAYKVLDVAGRGGRPHEVEVQVVAIGDGVAIVSLPGEVFVELGLAIKAASPFKRTFIAELANGSAGYIPDRPAYAQGNYEPLSARVAEGSGEMLAEAAAKLLKELALR